MTIPKGSGCQHSAFTVITSKEQCSKFSFIIARCSQKELPYTFHEREKSFNPQTVRCHQAKVMQLVGETSPEDTELCYSSTNQMSSTLTMVDYIFVVVYNHELFEVQCSLHNVCKFSSNLYCIQHIRKEYHGYSEDKQTNYWYLRIL